MPAPKEKPKGRAPQKKRVGFTPKEAGRIVREKYRQMAEQRQPEENEREHAAEHLQSGLEKSSVFVGDLAGREKDALRKSIAHSGIRKESTPSSESAPTNDTPNPVSAQEAPGPETGRRANTPKERPADATPEKRPNLGRFKNEVRRALPNEHPTDSAPEMRPNLGRIKNEVCRPLPKERPADAALDIKESYGKIELYMVLPCRDQSKFYMSEQSSAYQHLLDAATHVRYTSFAPYFEGCMRRRNHYLVDHSSAIIAYQTHGRSGTSQTTDYARKCGLKVINLAERL